MQQPIHIERPQGESRQDTVERLRRRLIPANQAREIAKDATTIINVDNPRGGWTQFKFAGSPTKEYIAKAVADAFALQEDMEAAGVRVRANRAPTLTADKMERHNGKFAKSTRNKFRGKDLYLNPDASAEYSRDYT